MNKTTKSALEIQLWCVSVLRPGSRKDWKPAASAVAAGNQPEHRFSALDSVLTYSALADVLQSAEQIPSLQHQERLCSQHLQWQKTFCSSWRRRSSSPDASSSSFAAAAEKHLATLNLPTPLSKSVIDVALEHSKHGCVSGRRQHVKKVWNLPAFSCSVALSPEPCGNQDAFITIFLVLRNRSFPVFQLFSREEDAFSASASSLVHKTKAERLTPCLVRDSPHALSALPAVTQFQVSEQINIATSVLTKKSRKATNRVMTGHPGLKKQSEKDLLSESMSNERELARPNIPRNKLTAKWLEKAWEVTCTAVHCGMWTPAAGDKYLATFNLATPLTKSVIDVALECSEHGCVSGTRQHVPKIWNLPGLFDYFKFPDLPMHLLAQGTVNVPRGDARLFPSSAKSISNEQGDAES